MKSDEVRTGLISLINKKKSSFQSGISEIVRREFDLVSQARESGASWMEIVDTLGFSGKESAMALAYWRERRRRAKKEKEVIPEQKTEKRIGVERKEEKKELPGSARPVSTGVTGTGKKPTDSKDPEPSGSGWREIKY